LSNVRVLWVIVWYKFNCCCVSETCLIILLLCSRNTLHLSCCCVLGNTYSYLLFVFQNHIYEWVRDHRAHHKFTDTDADPHNSQRGFFFCHIGWLMVRKHPDVKIKGKSIDMSDIEKDPIVVWQRR